MKKNLFIYTAVIVTGLSSCKKEFDTPPENVLATGNIITLDSLVNTYQGTDVRFTSDVSTYGVVTADEVDGNLYKNVYIQSGDAAINVRLLSGGGLYRGDSIRINLNGTKLTRYNGMLQLDSVDIDRNVVKQAVNVTVNPKVVNITDLTTDMQSQLIQLNNVEFNALELSMTWADAVNQQSEDRTLTDCSGNTVIVRTSGFANYAGLQIPQGNGSLVAIVGVYGSTIQLYLRSLTEATNMTGARCSGNPPYLYKDFEDASATSGGWSTQIVTGTANWTTNSTGAVFGSRYGQCSAFGTGSNSEVWLISPAVDLSAATNPIFHFQNACNYSGANIEVYVSTNYTSGAPSSATWTLVSPVLSTGSWSWVASGNISLTSYLTANTRIAFKYTGTSSTAKTWELDEITIEEN